MRVGALIFQKLAMGAALDDAAVVNHQNLVGIDDGGQWVVNGKRVAVGDDAPKFRLNERLRGQPLTRLRSALAVANANAPEHRCVAPD